MSESTPGATGINRTSADIRERTTVMVLAENLSLRKRLRSLYDALRLDQDKDTHDDAVAVCEALVAFYEANR